MELNVLNLIILPVFSWIFFWIWFAEIIPNMPKKYNLSDIIKKYINWNNSSKTPLVWKFVAAYAIGMFLAVGVYGVWFATPRVIEYAGRVSDLISFFNVFY